MQSTQEHPKKPYRKPTLRTIELAVDEVLGTGCKTSSTTDPGTTPCDGTESPCVGNGS